ncbi:hypothetical protein FSP39_019740, partial [Pinctada imbricata]
ILLSVWQHPYVNVFKHFNISTWKKATKEGEVSTLMDKTIKCTVYKITGSIPAGNYIQLPKAQTQSLGLTGRYMYILFKPIPSKYFVVHIDVATQDNLIVRVSFSNLFKEFKSTSTWLQFPFLCNAAKGTVAAYSAIGSKEHSGPAPMSTRWTILCLDFNQILTEYLNRKFSYVKSVRLCANMMVKNIFTSDTLYEPGISVDKAKKSGLLAKGLNPFPREMTYPVNKGENWYDVHDLIRFPSDGSKKPFDSIQFEEEPLKTGAPRGVDVRRVNPRSVDVSKCVSDRVAMIHRLTQPTQKMKRHQVTSELPPVGVDGMEIHRDDAGEVHVFAHPDEEVMIHQDSKLSGESTQIARMTPGSSLQPKKSVFKSLEPDPILKLKRIVGFGGSSFRDALWIADGSAVVYPCHAVVIAMKVSNGHQRFFIGHTDKVSAISTNESCSLLASGQTGTMSVVRVWKYQTGECLAMCKTHAHSLHSLRMVSCGRDNVRIWRVKEGQLRSAPVNLGEYHQMEFTDVCFEAGYHADKDPADRIVYACSRSGHVFEIDLKKVCIQHVRRLLPNDNRATKDKSTKSGPGLSINSMSVNETFCVMGSDDGFLRLWPLDFEHVYLEAEHEGPVTAVDFSSDGLKILAGTATGNLGILDISTRGYTTVMRSHTGRIMGVAVDPYRKHIATVSMDHTIRVWDSETLQQLYDFSAPDECPCCIAYHPSRQIFACGFESGVVRVFNVQSTSMLAEHKQHRGKIIGLEFSPIGDYLYSACSMGSLALYDARSDRYELLRLLGNTVVRGEKRGPNALAVSPDGRRMAFIGPSEYTVCVVDAKSLSEVLRIDITNVSAVECGKSSANIDSAERVYFSPESLGQLLVTTSNNKLLKFDGRSGRLMSEVANIHRSGCSCLAVTESGRHLATGGDKVIKIWDYAMKLDINFQVFIGHSENVSKLMWTPDGKSLLSVGEAIYVWDFMAYRPPSPTEGREYRETSYPPYHQPEKVFDSVSNISKSLADTYMELPRTPPRPVHRGSPGHRSPPISNNYASPVLKEPSKPLDTTNSPGRLTDISSIPKASTRENDIESLPSSSVRLDLPGVGKRSVPAPMHVPEPLETIHLDDAVQSHPLQRSPDNRKVKKAFGQKPGDKPGDVSKPTSCKHFQQREKIYGVAQRRYTAPPNQAGIKLRSVIGFNGSGRDNMVWQPDTGLFAYTCGCIVIIENLSTGEQKHLMGHTEEISTLTLQNDCQALASASGSFGMSPSQICIWDLQQFTCKKVLSYHEYDIVCLAYSREDRFLVSVGDYRDNSIVVWSTYNYQVLTTYKTTAPVHDLAWDPYTVNEFASVGQDGTVLFWLLDETTTDVCLNVHEAEVPQELLQSQIMGNSHVDFTSLEYAGDSTLFISTNNGKMSVWDTRHNSCFMHWEADTSEIGVVLCRRDRLLTGSQGKNLRIWAVSSVGSMKAPGDNGRNGGITMEDEINLDGAITSAAFDESLEMGIVGTSAGTIWYINWPERTSIRLVSSHVYKVNGLACINGHIASCADDGSLRLWSIENREQVLQFQVLDQTCTCVAFSPQKSRPDPNYQSQDPDSAEEKILSNVTAGYSDGTIRMFDVNKVEMVLKMHPHAVSVTAISFSSDGRMIISGGKDGLIAISSPTTGMTVRVISDHKGAPITNIDVTVKDDIDVGINAPLLWLATSADRRVSVWSADWSKDFCELVDWLTFPAPAFSPEGVVVNKKDQCQLPPSLAKFSTEEPDMIIYLGYGMQKCVQFYSLSQRKVVRTSTLTHWTNCFDIAESSPLLAIGVNERLLKLMDYYEGSFQDFIGHNDSINAVKFSPDGKFLFSVAHAEIFIWDVTV